MIDRLADEVGREALLKLRFILKRRVVLSERHRAGVEPHVNYLGDARHRLAALGAREADVIDVGAVRIVDQDARELFELLERADALGVAVGAAPDRQRSAPVALA